MFRVFLGGSWGSDAKRLRTSCRFTDFPTFRYGYLGLRIVKEDR